MSALSREKILALFDSLNARLAEKELTGDLYVVGGAVLCIVHRTRSATQDVDAIFEPKSVIRELAASVGQDFGLPEDWLNDGVKGFMGHHSEFEEFLDLSNLRIMTASSEYLLAMKSVAMRLGAEFHDEDDVRFLLRYLGVDSYDEAINIVTKYFPIERVPPKTHYALEEILEDLNE